MNKKMLVLLALGCQLSAAASSPGALYHEVLVDTSKVVDLDEVVVVSQPKEAYRLRLQPVSSTVLTAEGLTNLHVTDLRELSDYVPSFVMPAYGSRYTSSMYIRGIGSRVNNPAVGVYLDNIPLVSKSMHNMHTYQLDRVDVLRGPQGTLYGQNTEGGLVRMYSRHPLNYQGTDIRLGIATGLYRNVEAAHNARLSDVFGLSVAGFYNGQNGFFKNQATDEKADKYDEAGGKLRLIWQPTDRLSLDWMADYQYVKQNGFPYGLVDKVSEETADPSTNRQGTYDRNMLTTGLNIGYRGNLYNLDYTISWQYLKDNMLMDIDYLPRDFMHMEQAQLQNAITQELVLKSKKSERWHRSTGAFFSRQWLKTDAPVYFDSEMNAFLSKTIEDYAYYGMLNSMAARMGMEAAKTMIERAGGCHIAMAIDPIPGLFRTPQTNYGLFHESNIELLSHLTATIGLRYDHSHVSIDYLTSARAVLDESVMGVNVKAYVNSMLQHDESDNYEQLLPKFGLSYRLDRHGSNIYATVSKGYRAGGYNIQMFSDILQTELQNSAQSARDELNLEHDANAYENIRHTIAYKPEVSWNYEVGTHLNLFDSQVHFDFAAYYMQIRNQQLSVMAGNYGFGRMMVNAGKSYSCGLEAALRGSAFDNRLSWSLAYGYTHAVFKNYIDSVKVDGVNVPVDYAKKHVPYVPEHTFSIAADYHLDKLTLGANLSGQGKTYWDETNDYQQKLYAKLGAHVDYDLGPVVVTLWGQNLTDAKYNTFAVSSSANGEKLTFAQRANPLQVGLDVNIHL